MAKKKMKVKMKKARRKPDPLRALIVAGVGVPLAFTAIKKGVQILPAVGKGAEALGNIGNK